MDIEKLKKYLEETPLEELKKEWDEIVEQFPSDVRPLIKVSYFKLKELQQEIADSDKIALKAIELCTQLNYGSKRSMEYLEQAKKLIK